MTSETIWSDGCSEDLQLSRARARQAKAQIQRCALYSAGSRARLPRTKPRSPTRSSSEASFEPARPRPSTAIPPGAHEDTYRVLYPPTASKQCTSEQLFWATTSMTDGIRVMPQPPWYYGYANKVQPSDSNILNSATRYGYRGSQSIRQFTRSPHARPEHTLTSKTPAFLRRETLERQRAPDVWVPPLEARSSMHRQTLLNSPKLWPEPASFVTGFKGKRPASSAWYRKETTASFEQEGIGDEEEQAAMDPRLVRAIAMLDEERDNFSAFAHLEREGALLSRPHTMASVFWDATGSRPATAQAAYASNERRHLNTAASTSSSTTVGRPAPPPAVQLRYSAAQIIVAQQKLRDQVQYEHESGQHPLTLHLRLRWQNVFVAHRAMSRALKRDRDTRRQVMKLAEQMRAQAKKRALPTQLNKGQFMRTLDSFALLRLMTVKQRNWLFAVFDGAKHNAIRFVEMIATMGVLDKPDEPASAVLQWLWELYETYGRDQSPLENAQAIFLTCCYEEDERQTGVDKFSVIRSECYRRIATMSVKETLDERASQRDAAVSSQFNLCDISLTFNVFLNVLTSLPDCLAFFESTLASRRSQYQQYVDSMSL